MNVSTFACSFDTEIHCISNTLGLKYFLLFDNTSQLKDVK